MLKGVKQLWPSSGSAVNTNTQNSSTNSNNPNTGGTASPRDTGSPNLSPSTSFATLHNPADQTPRAVQTANPFDSPGLSRSTAGLTLDSNRRAASPALSAGGGGGGGGAAAGMGSMPLPSGLRTPTSVGFQPLGTPGAGQPTTGVTVGDQLGRSSGGFGLHEPPKMRKALSKLTEGKDAAIANGLIGAGGSGAQTPTTEDGGGAFASSSTGYGNGAQQQHQPQHQTGQQPHQHHHQASPRGTLSVKLISARGLAVSHSSHAQPAPYVVMQFEQNEFISSGPHPAASHNSVPFTTSTAQPIQPGNLTRSASGLGVGTISRAFAEAMGRGKKKEEQLAQQGSGAQTPRADDSHGSSWLGKPGPGDPIWKEEVAFDLTSSTSALHVSVYDRGKEGEGFLGMTDIKPVLKDGYTLDGWYKLGTRGNEVVTGEIWIQMTYTAARSKVHLKPADFEFLKLIGRGTFGRVFQVRKKDTRRIYAMKVLSKKEIVAKKEVAHTIGERKILQRSLECPFLVGLKFSFQTEKELYFVTDYKCGGELFWHLQKEGRFSEDRARFYIAELILALEHLHKYNIVYRDLKPENILLDATGHVALCDFGLSKPDLTNDQLTNTFCGTTEYLAPEVLLDEKGYGKHVDFWSLGVLLFEMCCGWSPFYAEQTQEMYRLICYGKIRFPKHVIGDDGKQFVKGLLNRNPQNRLGARRGAAELKEHPFFRAIDWDLLYRKQITPPFKPIVDSDESVANFDPEFTNASLQEAGAPITDDEDYREVPQQPGKHTYVGPGGSLHSASYMSHAAGGGAGGGSATGGVAINQAKKAAGGVGSGGVSGLAGSATTPLSSSVQENFRGFTYTGESLMPASILAGGDHSMDEGEDNEHAVDEMDDEDDEEYEDEDMDGARTRRQSDVEMD